MSVIKQCGLVTAFKLGQNEPVTLMDWVSNVDGNMLGKSFTATGSRNSMKGTTTKTRKGTRRKRSAQIDPRNRAQLQLYCHGKELYSV